MSIIENLSFSICSGDKEHSLKDIVDFTLIKSMDSPATAVKLVHLIDKKMSLIGEISIIYNGCKIFSGVLDRERSTIKNGYIYHSIEARGEGAKLIDCEAKPSKYKNTRFIDIFENYVAPFCLLKNEIFSDEYAFEFTVGKGCSLWQIVNKFCSDVYKKMPFVSRGKICLFKKSKSINITNKILSLEENFKPCEIISKVYIRNKNGEYSGCVTNPVYPMEKKYRYYVPSDEWEHGEQGAERIIKRSMLKSKSTKITFMGLVDIEPGDMFEFIAMGKNYNDCVAWEITIDGSKEGVTTTITAVSAKYI